MSIEIQQKTGKSVAEMGLNQRKERPRFSESIAADSEISFPLCGNYTLGELPSSSGKAGQEFFPGLQPQACLVYQTDVSSVPAMA